jgi:hypothetical protein
MRSGVKGIGDAVRVGMAVKVAGACAAAAGAHAARARHISAINGFDIAGMITYVISNT